MRSRLVNCIAVVLWVSFIPLISQALIIDDFNDVGKATWNNSPVETISTSAVGGVRTLSAAKTSGELDIYIETRSGTLFHNQDSGVSGNSQVFWNGGAHTNIYGGLGGLDLTQDGGTSLVLEKLNFDFAYGKSLTVAITLYDASDSFSGLKSSSYSFTLTESKSDQNITIPFSSFTVPGIMGLADVKNIGAISLVILGGQNPDTDLNMAAIKTDGKCDQNVPDSQMKVIDDCGVCGGSNEAKDSCGVCFGEDKDKDDCGICFGNNKDKDQCGVCFGDNKDIDDCGVCFGNNKDLDDCGICGGNNLSKDMCGVCGGDGSSCKDCLGVPNGTAKYDVCGVCAGDGKSCLDCANVPNGTAKIDQCGVCNGNGKSCLDCNGTPYGVAVLDRCGVCAGDGMSCIQCTEEDISGLLLKLAAKSNDQRKNAFFYLLRVIDADPTFAKSSRAKVVKLHAKLLGLIKELPHQVKECEETPFCVLDTRNVSVIKAYSTTAKKLYLIAQNILLRNINQGPGRCTGSAKECQARVSARKRNTQSLKAYNRRLYLQNIALIKKIPKVISVCEE